MSLPIPHLQLYTVSHKLCSFHLQDISANHPLSLFLLLPFLSQVTMISPESVLTSLPPFITRPTSLFLKFQPESSFKGQTWDVIFLLKTLQFFFFFLAVPCGLQDLSSPIRDRTCVPCIGSTESYSLDHQGSPQMFFLALRIKLNLPKGLKSHMVAWSHLSSLSHLLPLLFSSYTKFLSFS